MAITLDTTRLLTCSHVVERAVGQLKGEIERGLDVVVNITWPLTPEVIGRARVMREWWKPEDGYGKGDVAVLELLSPLPETSIPAPLASLSDHEGHRFKAYGLPMGDMYPVACDGTMRGYEGPGGTWVRLEGRQGVGRAIDPGFSGTAVWDLDAEAVVGMIVARDQVKEAKSGYFIPMEQVAQFCPVIYNYLPTPFERSATAREHWIPRARGVSNSTESGWFFTGRDTIYKELVAPLLSGASASKRLFCVTGSPGSGKSAILARIPVLADRRLAKLAKRTPLETTLEHAKIIPIYLRQKTFLDVLDELGRALGRRIESVDHLQQTLAARARKDSSQMAIVFDGLDEAADPNSRDRIARELIKQLGYYARDLRLTIIVACRSGIPGSENEQLIEALGSRREVLVVDKPPFVDREQLQLYVESRLIAGGSDSGSHPYRDRPDYAHKLARDVATAAYPNFLVAQLVSQSLLDDPSATERRLAEKRFPSNVADALSDFIAKFGSNRQRATDLLRGLAYARGAGFQVGQLWLSVTKEVTGNMYSLDDLKWLLNSAAAFLIESLDENYQKKYRLYHQALVDVLQSGDGLRTVFGYLVHRGINAKDDETVDYLQEHLSGHALSAKSLDTLLTSPELLAVCGARGLLRDSARADTQISSNGLNVRIALAGKAHTLDLCRNRDQRAAYLKLAGHQHKVVALAKQPKNYWWDCYWSEWQATSEHQVILRGEFIAKVSSVAMDDERLIVTGDDTGRVKIIDPVSHHSRYEVELDSAITALFVLESASTPMALVGTEAGWVWILKGYQGGMRAFKVGRLDGVVSCLTGVFMQRGDVRFAAGSDSGDFLYQRRKPGQKVEEYRTKHSTWVCDVAFFGINGNFLLTALRDGHVSVMIARTMSLDPGYGVNTDEEISRVFLAKSSPDEGQTVLIATEHSIDSWNLDYGLPLDDSIPMPGDGLSLLLSERDGLRVLIVSDSSLVRVIPWVTSGGGLVLQGHDEPIRDLAELVLGSDHYVLSSSQDATVRLWPAKIGADSTQVGSSAEPLALGISDDHSGAVAVVLGNGETIGTDTSQIKGVRDAHTITDIEYVSGRPLVVQSHRFGVYLGGSMVTGENATMPPRIVRISDRRFAISVDSQILIGRYSWNGPEAWRELRNIKLEGKIVGIHACAIDRNQKHVIVARIQQLDLRDVCILDPNGEVLFNSASHNLDVYDAVISSSGDRRSVVIVDEQELIKLAMVQSERSDWELSHAVKRSRPGEALLTCISSLESRYLLMLESGSLSVFEADRLGLIDEVDLGGGRPTGLKTTPLNPARDQWAVLVGTSAGVVALRLHLSELGARFSTMQKHPD